MAQPLNTQFVAMRLITSIFTQDEEGIKGLIDPEITLTSTLNGGDPVIKRGQEEYLAAVREIWDRVIRCDSQNFEYGKFTENSGDLKFRQICLVRRDQGEESIQSQGEQTFTFRNGKISSIIVEEMDAKISQPNASKLTGGGCLIS